MLEMIGTSAITGLITTFATVFVLKNDISWLKKTCDSHTTCIDSLHGRIDTHISTLHSKGV